MRVTVGGNAAGDKVARSVAKWSRKSCGERRSSINRANEAVVHCTRVIFKHSKLLEIFVRIAKTFEMENDLGEKDVGSEFVQQ